MDEGLVSVRLGVRGVDPLGGDSGLSTEPCTARIPRDIGTKTGVNDTDGSEAPQAAKFCAAQGYDDAPRPQRRHLPTPSAQRQQMRLERAPAPEGPLAATMTTSRRSSSRA